MADSQADQRQWLLRQNALIASMRNYVIDNYSSIWRQMTAEWREKGDDMVWLQYSANYLFRTGDTRWAVDLALPFRNLKGARVPDELAQDLSALRFVLLTHEHEDHFDSALMMSVAHLGIKWLVPEHMVSTVIEKSHIARSSVIVAKPGIEVEVAGIRVTPFEGLHWENRFDEDGVPRQRLGVPSTGYLVQTQNKRLLFPGDCRTYAAERLPAFGAVDWVFAHLWLGREPLQDVARMIAPFCRFVLDLNPVSILLSHLHEVLRPVGEYWSYSHAGMAMDYLAMAAPEVAVRVPRFGDGVAL